MRLADLAEVNEEVNSLPYVADADRYGRPEFWAEISASGGDCEDFAIGKLNRLAARRWPIESLRLAACYVETGEYHAVLVAGTPTGDMVLDNRKPDPIPVSELAVIGYRPDRIQEAGGSKTWVRWIGT